MFLLGRILFGGTFFFMGMNHFLRFSSMVDYAAASGLPAPSLAIVVSGLMLVAGGLMVAFGFQPKAGAAVLVLFLLSAAFLVHDFWTILDPETARAEMVHFLKNLALAGGGLLILYIPEPWPNSLATRAAPVRSTARPTSTETPDRERDVPVGAGR